MVEKYMCVVNKTNTQNVRRSKPLPEVKETALNPCKRRAVCEQNPCVLQPRLFHSLRRSDSVAVGPRANSVYVSPGQERSLRLLWSSVGISPQITSAAASQSQRDPEVIGGSSERYVSSSHGCVCHISFTPNAFNLEFLYASLRNWHFDACAASASCVVLGTRPTRE